jgi:hypothetical protein
MRDDEQTVELSRVVHKKNLRLPEGVLLNLQAGGKNGLFSI